MQFESPNKVNRRLKFEDTFNFVKIKVRPVPNSDFQQIESLCGVKSDLHRRHKSVSTKTHVKRICLVSSTGHRYYGILRMRFGSLPRRFVHVSGFASLSFTQLCPSISLLKCMFKGRRFRHNYRQKVDIGHFQSFTINVRIIFLLYYSQSVDLNQIILGFYAEKLALFLHENIIYIK